MTDDDTQECVDTVWVTSLGGPLILIPESACYQWGGAPDNYDYPDHTGDYGRACAVNDFVGLIDVGPTKALVLGDHPADTTFVPEHGILIRVIASEPDLDPTSTVAALLADVEWEPGLSWEVTEPVILFDAAYDYPYVIDAEEQRLRVNLAPARYDVQAAYVEIPDEAFLVLIRLTADSGASR